MNKKPYPTSRDHIRVSRPSERGEDILTVHIPQPGEEKIKKWQCLSCGAGNNDGVDKCYACGNSREELERLLEEECEMDAKAAERAKDEARYN